MSWRLAPSLTVLLDQINTRWPARRKDSDGTIGDENHSARSSDHNPDNRGVVCGMDITHDPRSGCDSYALAEVFRAARDPRIEYLISNHRICSSHVDPWLWRPYHGVNAHDHHVHISVKHDPKFADDKLPWNLDAKPMPAPSMATKAILQTLRKGDHGEEVKQMQGQLVAHSIKLEVDGQFGPATETAVKQFQRSRGLVADGICGPMTWDALDK